MVGKINVCSDPWWVGCSSNWRALLLGGCFESANSIEKTLTFDSSSGFLEEETFFAMKDERHGSNMFLSKIIFKVYGSKWSQIVWGWSLIWLWTARFFKRTICEEVVYIDDSRPAKCSQIPWSPEVQKRLSQNYRTFYRTRTSTTDFCACLDVFGSCFSLIINNVGPPIKLQKPTLEQTWDSCRYMKVSADRGDPSRISRQAGFWLGDGWLGMLEKDTRLAPLTS